jgi:hypothetical protein
MILFPLMATSWDSNLRESRFKKHSKEQTIRVSTMDRLKATRFSTNIHRMTLSLPPMLDQSQRHSMNRSYNRN